MNTKKRMKKMDASKKKCTSAPFYVGCYANVECTPVSYWCDKQVVESLRCPSIDHCCVRIDDHLRVKLLEYSCVSKLRPSNYSFIHLVPYSNLQKSSQPYHYLKKWILAPQPSKLSTALRGFYSKPGTFQSSDSIPSTFETKFSDRN